MSEQPEGQAPEAADTTPTTTEAPKPEAPRVDKAAEDKGQEPKTFNEAYVKKLREENAENRVKAKEAVEARTAAEQRQQAQMDAIAKALGLKDDDAPPDPEKLTAQLTETAKERDATQAELRTMRVERAAEKAAREHGADVDTLLDSRSFANKLAGLDPTDSGFSEAVSDLVRATVDSNPKYKAAQVATSSSADFSSGPGEQRKRTNSLHAAARSHYGVGGD
ncbi:hypothetical protein [Nocardiopsis sp. NRRL B-16309]|uniref:hypothetical protein n=1 Tax=Nocardiopsis sp. NRRL B-16309 TaxID=1519494 RepID=UPI0006ADDC63|nr:hypothetical protein [Nocardiopsis sp. NRRL B-16309]